MCYKNRRFSRKTLYIEMKKAIIYERREYLNEKHSFRDTVRSKKLFIMALEIIT